MTRRQEQQEGLSFRQSRVSSTSGIMMWMIILSKIILMTTVAAAWSVIDNGRLLPILHHNHRPARRLLLPTTTDVHCRHYRSETAANGSIKKQRLGDTLLRGSFHSHKEKEPSTTDRRGFLVAKSSYLALLWAATTAGTAQARGLAQFPCTEPLGNTYHFLRAGESLLEADDIWSTNPLFLTNREAALSERGIQQVKATCGLLKERGVNPTVLRYSLAASAMDTTNLVGKELRLGRDRLVPEFNFMDPRAVGQWDMQPLSTTEPAVWAMDADEAGVDGKGGRPPANEDSTPHETLHDQTVRLRQLLSVLETQYSGDTILLVFPDGTGPALLSAMIAGIPLSRVHELEFRPGELRLDVTMDTTLALLEAKKKGSEEDYSAALQRGRTELQRLRNMSPDTVLSVKDQRLEQERIELEREQERIAQVRTETEDALRAAQRERVKQIEVERQKKRDELAAERREQMNQRRKEAKPRNSLVSQGDSGPSPMSIVVGSVAVAAVGGLALAKGGDVKPRTPAMEENDMELTVETVHSNETLPNGQYEDDMLLTSNGNVTVESAEHVSETKNGTSSEQKEASVDGEIIGEVAGESSTDVLDEMAAQSTKDINGGSGDNDWARPSRDRAKDRLQTAEEAMQEYLDSDDGGEAWLQMMADIAQEEEEDQEMTDANSAEM